MEQTPKSENDHTVESTFTVDENSRNIPHLLPILAVRDQVLYPLTFLPLAVDEKRSIALINAMVNDQSRLIGIVSIKDSAAADPTGESLFSIGTAAIIHRLVKLPDGSMRVVLQGIERIRIIEYVSTEPYLTAKIEIPPEVSEKNAQVEALMHNTVELTRRLVTLVPYLPDELFIAAINVNNPRQLVYLIAGVVRGELQDRQELLELNTIQEKFEKLNALISKELEVLELGKKIQSQAQGEIEKTQREYILREQLRQIQKELGEGAENAELNEYEKKITDAGMSMEAAKEARRELARLKSMPSAAAEFHMIKTYLEWLIELPWSKATTDNLDIARAREILDEDHYDLKDVKERLLEYLAVRKLRFDRAEPVKSPSADIPQGSILCFVGPPGVGKTSLGHSIARALGRKFIRMSLGGMHDEAEVRGHRRTYIGALPGRIMQSIRRAESHNPVLMLDEIDKVGTDFRGDPSSALLEVLDPAQNKTFRDHFLDVDFDLSQVIFICTANQLDPIQPALRDRMEILQLSGYTDDEKIKIASGYLVPRQIEENSLRVGEINFTDESLRRLIRDYTREAGVRNLERAIGRVCRKTATLIAEGKPAITTIMPDTVGALLGKPLFYGEVAERTTIPGVATGLAWTPVGGDILFIEATRMPGAKGFIVTGQLGDVMKESAQAALSYVRANADMLGIDKKLFHKSDIHLHIPEGATPKDGPSAGVTMATAIASLMLNRTVKNNLAMTGEITLRGRVLPVGGIKEKTIAAHRAGLTTVIVPRRNEKDLDDLPDQVRREIRFILVETVNDVFAAALEAPLPLAPSPAH